MQLLQIHAFFALSECIFCTNLDWLLLGVSDGHSAISNSRASWEQPFFICKRSQVQGSRLESDEN